jgi:hypothetical protein
MQSLFLGEDIPAQNIPNGIFFPAHDDVNLLLYSIFTAKITIFDYNYNKLVKEQVYISEKDELKNLRTGLYRVINALFTETRNEYKLNFLDKLLKKIELITGVHFNSAFLRKEKKEYPLEYFDAVNKIDDIINLSRRNGKIIYIFQDGIFCYKILNGSIKKITSKAAGRLARIYQSIPC